MKRVIILVLLILSIILGYNIIANGFSINLLGFEVYSYEEVENQSETLTLAVAAYNKKNNTEFETILASLETAKTEYEEAKEEYEKVIEELGTVTDSTETEEIIYASSFPVYEIDFLWATIGNYAKKEGLTITMDVNQNTAITESTLGYGLYNLSFLVTGEYINIADFLYDIEDDDQLGFEIRDYSMTAGTATFTIYNVPINSDTLIENSTTLETTDDTEETEDEDEDEDEDSSSRSSNTVSSNTSNSTNTTNNTTN